MLVAGRASFRQSGRRYFNNNNNNRRVTASHILLSDIPRTATPADIRRAISRSDVVGVSDIALDYKYFKPTERAILTLVSPSYLAHNLTTLQHLTISGLPVSSQPYVPDSPPVEEKRRTRGHEGRAQAAERGALSGDGPNAGINENKEMNVIFSGLPARTTIKDLAELLKDFDVALSSKGLLHIQKIAPPGDVFALTAKFIVTLNSVTEAHRLVRAKHATYHGNDFLLSAKIIY